MPTPLAICLEDLDFRDPDRRYLRCVALVGRQPGLRVDRHGAVSWERDEDTACELWVSADDRLILFRPAGAVEVTIRRAGRTLDVPQERPVVTLDQDCFEVGDRRFRVHVHGVAPAVSAPSMLVQRKAGAGAAAGLAAAMALSTAVTGCCDGAIDVLDSPPEVAPIDTPIEPATPEPVTPSAPPPPIDVLIEPPAVAIEMPTPEPVTPEPITPTPEVSTPAPPIEVRMEPPDMAMPEDPVEPVPDKAED
jgi:hypothetical protein